MPASGLSMSLIKALSFKRYTSQPKMQGEPAKEVLGVQQLPRVPGLSQVCGLAGCHTTPSVLQMRGSVGRNAVKMILILVVRILRTCNCALNDLCWLRQLTLWIEILHPAHTQQAWTLDDSKMGKLAHVLIVFMHVCFPTSCQRMQQRAQSSPVNAMHCGG